MPHIFSSEAVTFVTAGEIESEGGDNLICLMIGQLAESWKELSEVWEANAEAVSVYVT